MNLSWIALAATLCAAPACAAETCTLQSLGTLPLTVAQDGTLLVPANISGNLQPMAVELGSPESALDEAFAGRMNYDTSPLRGAFDYRGATVRSQVSLPWLQLGVLTGHHVSVLLLPAAANLPQGVAGVLGSRLLGTADLDLDVAGRSLTLYAPEHCAGQGVTWADSAAIIPFTRDALQRIVFRMQLDGKDVSVSFGRGNAAQMPFSVAERLFGFNYAAIYDRNRFQSLSAGGIAIARPVIHIVDDTAAGCAGPNQPVSCLSRPDLELGLSEIVALHLFIAFSENKLYATAAGAHK